VVPGGAVGQPVQDVDRPPADQASVQSAQLMDRGYSFLDVSSISAASSPRRRRGRWVKLDLMSKPAILAVDDDLDVSAAITRDLRGRYSADYLTIESRPGRTVLRVRIPVRPALPRGRAAS
jgi:hypothetical protein